MIENLIISEIFSIFVISTKQITQKIAMITESKITEFFCIADDFCKIFNQKIQKYTFKTNTKRNYHRDSILSIAEV